LSENTPPCSYKEMLINL